MTMPFEATNRALDGGYRKPVADRLHVSGTTVALSCLRPRELDGIGLPAPVQRFIETQLELAERSHPDPFYLLRYACRELGFLPPVRNDAVADPTRLDVIADASREFSEIVAGFAKAYADGIFNASDAETILPEVEDMIRLVLAPLAATLQKIIVEDEEAREQNRRGPHRSLPRFFELRRRSA